MTDRTWRRIEAHRALVVRAYSGCSAARARRAARNVVADARALHLEIIEAGGPGLPKSHPVWEVTG